MDINDLFVFNDVTKDKTIKLYKKAEDGGLGEEITDTLECLKAIGWTGSGNIPTEEWSRLMGLTTKEVLDSFADPNLTRDDICFDLPESVKYCLTSYERPDRDRIIFYHKEYGFCVYRYKGHTFAGRYLILFTIKGDENNLLYGVGVRDVKRGINFLTRVWFRDIKEFDDELNSLERWF